MNETMDVDQGGSDFINSLPTPEVKTTEDLIAAATPADAPKPTDAMLRGKEMSQTKFPGMEPVYDSSPQLERSGQKGALLGYKFPYSQVQDPGMVASYSKAEYGPHGNLVDPGGKFLGYQVDTSRTYDAPKSAEILALEKKFGTTMDPIYATQAVGGRGGDRQVEYGLPIGYRFDNGNSQYVSYDANGKYIGTQDRSKNSLLPLLGVLAMPFLGPLAFEAMGLGAGAAGAGALGAEALGAGALGAAFTPEMIAAGLAPGSIGALGAASGALTGAELAAASGIGSLGAGALTGAAGLESLTPITETTGEIAAGTNAAGAGGYGSGITNPSLLSSGAGEIAALPASEVASLGSSVAPSVNEMIASGMSPGSAGALGATTGALTPAELAAASGVVTAGATPALVELANAGKGLPSTNEMVASGGGPGSAGAAGAAAGQLTPAELAATNGVSTAGSATAGLTSSMLDKLKEATGLSADQLKALVGGAGGLLAAYQANQPQLPTGYQGGIPSYTAVQGRAAEPVAGSRPGAGHQYFTGVKFTPTAGLPAAQAAIDAQVTDLNKLNTDAAKARIAAPSQNSSMTPDDFMKSDDYKRYQSDSANQLGTTDMYNSPYFGMQSSGSYGRGLDKAYEIARNNQSLAPPPTKPVVPEVKAAHGGIMGLAHGGKPTHPHGTYLRGDTDGMADKIPGTIDGVQPARLAHGEFVIPADVVSHLGNGNSDAGAKQLYKMMDRIRMARTGTREQGKEINPSKFMPGGLASYAVGGALPEGTTGTESNLSNWAGPYVTDLLGKTQALTSAALEKPQFYQGELTAGPSELQNKAYDQAGTLTGQSFTNAGTAGSYMSPYMQNVVDIQKREAQRQSGIQGTQQQAQAAQAGAFGGSRDAIMRAERERNLGTQMNDIQAQGLQSAYQAAQNQYNTEQNKNVTNLNALANLGNTQQQTAQAGLTAAQQQFELQKADPYKQLQFQQSMLQNMPLQAQSYNTTTNPLAAAAAGASGANTLFKSIFG
jgi:hypothetical protein